jgi:hypothetical protein
VLRCDMDRDILLEHLALCERHIALGEKHLAKQEALVADLDRKGRDTADALAILATLRETQALHVLDRDRLLKELEQ